MFNLFGKKVNTVNVIDIVWPSREAKWKGIVDQWKKDRSPVIICWFDATLHDLQSLFNRETSLETSIYTVSQVRSVQLKGKPVIFAEHYPLKKKEQDLFQQWSLPEVIIHSALDEPLFLHFGSEKIIQLMKQLGMKEDEPIKHTMISKAITSAQEKIEKKVTAELLCSSQQEWLEKNLVL